MSNIITVGKHTYGHNNIRVHFQEDGFPAVTIGNFCSIADEIDIFVGGEHAWKWVSTYPFGIVNKEAFPVDPVDGVSLGIEPVIIGHDVWIGHGVTIMSGVTIGNGAVVAANSHVYKDIGPYELWGGNPAKFIRKRFSDATIEILEYIQWWNKPDEEIMALIHFLQAPPNLGSTR
jgi:acetyltransferase-like isoleucine patch superfamily enzyme